MHTAVKMPPQRRAGMQEDPAVGIALVPASSNLMGSRITSDCRVQRSCSAKLYVLRSGRHGGQREQRLSPPSRKMRPNGSKSEAGNRPIPTLDTQYLVRVLLCRFCDVTRGV